MEASVFEMTRVSSSDDLLMVIWWYAPLTASYRAELQTLGQLRESIQILWTVYQAKPQITV